MEGSPSEAFSPLSQVLSLFSGAMAYLRRLTLQVLTMGPIPEHIAIIMDGNRRFADRSRMDRTKAHHFGYDRLISTLGDCYELGVKFVTVYAFSIDNFKRSPDEVSTLMDLMEEKLDHLAKNFGVVRDFGVKVSVLGDLTLLPESVRRAAERAMLSTKGNTSLVLNLCLAYTSTAEIVNSIQLVRNEFLIDVAENGMNCSHPGSGTVLSEAVSQRDPDDVSERENRGQDDLTGLSKVEIVENKPSILMTNSKSFCVSSSEHTETDTSNEAAATRIPASLPKSEMPGSVAGNRSPQQDDWTASLVNQRLTCGDKDEGHSHNRRVGECCVSATIDRITVEDIDSHLYTSGCPPPDLLIRTSGETRLSNFLLWQCSHTHLAFCKVLWPEFGLKDLVCIILEYQRTFSALRKQQRLYEHLAARSKVR